MLVGIINHSRVWLNSTYYRDHPVPDLGQMRSCAS